MSLACRECIACVQTPPFLVNLGPYGNCGTIPEVIPGYPRVETLGVYFYA